MGNQSFMKMSNHIYFVRGMNRGRYPYSNSIFIKNDGGGCLIDSGMGLNTLSRLKDKVDVVFYTHWHEDHISGNSFFTKKYIHEMDKPAVEDMSIFCGRYPFPIKECKRMINIFKFSFEKNSFLTFGKEDIFECGDVLIGVFYTPGHTIGHSTFLLYDGNSVILFLGDIDLSDFGPWYGGMDSDLDQFIDSIVHVKELVGSSDIDTVVSSHVGVFRGKSLIMEKLNRYLYIIFEREKKIVDNIGDGATLEDLVGRRIIYTDILKEREYRYYVEKRMIKLHLERLLRMRHIKEKNGFIYK